MTYRERNADFNYFVKEVCPKYFIKFNEEVKDNYFQADYVLQSLYEKCKEMREDNF